MDKSIEVIGVGDQGERVPHPSEMLVHDPLWVISKGQSRYSQGNRPYSAINISRSAAASNSLAISTTVFSSDCWNNY